MTAELDIATIYKLEPELLPSNAPAYWLSTFEVTKDGSGRFVLWMMPEKIAVLEMVVPSKLSPKGQKKISMKAMKFTAECGKVCAADAGHARVKGKR